MIITPELVVSFLTAIGLSGFIGALIQSRLDQEKQIKEHEHELKRKRYGVILVLMLTRLDSKVGLPRARAIRPDFQSLEDVEKEIEAELLHAVLFANDAVLKTLADFARAPSRLTYIKVAVSMRRDLWNKKTSINEETFQFIDSPKS
jgi:hypothetical protein